MYNIGMKKKIIITLFVFIIVIIGSTFIINLHMINSSKDRIIDNPNIDNVDAILVLGCKAYQDHPSLMLEERLLKAIDVYNETNYKLLLSGDHGTYEYDEINVMANYMIDNDIPKEDIFVDHAGFNTYDSIYRAKYVFGAKKVLIITQEYHMYRALYLAEKLGLEAYGIVANDIPYKGIMLKNQIREILSRDKNFFKAIIKPESKYLGEMIDLKGNGNFEEE